MKLEQQTIKTALIRAIKEKNSWLLGNTTGRGLKAIIRFQCKEMDEEMKYIFGSGIGDIEASMIVRFMIQYN